MHSKLLFFAVLVVAISLACADDKNKLEKLKKNHKKPAHCTCGVFLSGQFKKGSKMPPKGEPVLMQELDNYFANNAIGQRQCANKCLETIVPHLPKCADIVCASLDRDCHKEKAYLFTKNYSYTWYNTNMSAGREFCCKDNLPYKCPLL